MHKVKQETRLMRHKISNMNKDIDYYLALSLKKYLVLSKCFVTALGDCGGSLAKSLIIFFPSALIERQ